MLFQLHINDTIHQVDVFPGTSLLSVLREDLGLTGSRFGCGHGICGACFVLMDGQAVSSCECTVQDSIGKRITTIEGLAKNGELHPVQRAFLEEDAMQCGYCTSGMILSAVALLSCNASPSDDEIREAMSPHLCRCGVYGRVIRAIRRVTA